MITLFGSGSVGSLIGAQLRGAGASVCLVGRGPHLKAIRGRGLDLEVAGAAREGAFRPLQGLRIPAFASLAEAVKEAGPPEAIFLTVKAFDVQRAVADIAAIPAASGAPVVSLVNGLGTEEAAAAVLGPERIVAGVTTVSVDRPRPGAVRLHNYGGIALAPFVTDPEAQRRLAGSPWVGDLRTAGFDVRLHDRGDSIKWSKLLLNLWSSASAAVFDKPPDELVADPSLFHIDWLAFQEALRLMATARIPAVNLPGYPVRLLVALARTLPEGVFRRVLGRKVAGGRGGKMPSLWIDRKAGRGRSEITVLNGALVQAGRRLGVPTPANLALTASLLLLLEHPEGL